jgi:hypothetical protein
MKNCSIVLSSILFRARPQNIERIANDTVAKLVMRMPAVIAPLDNCDAASPHAADEDQPDRVTILILGRPKDACNGKRYVRLGLRQGAFSHSLRNISIYGAAIGQKSRWNAKRRYFLLFCVDDETSLKKLGGVFRLREASGNQTRGAGLGRHDVKAAALQSVERIIRGFYKVL